MVSSGSSLEESEFYVCERLSEQLYDLWKREMLTKMLAAALRIGLLRQA